ncbi:MAG: polysaccharide pyruvyl transferase family protein [Methylococcales bacterium]
MNKATLVGYHGHKNLGDDIFREILFNWMSKDLGVGNCAITATKGSIVPHKKIEIKYLESPIKKISRSIWLPIFSRAMKSNYLIFSAGSIFTIQPFFIIYMLLLLLRLLRRDLKIYAVGVSAGPYKSDFDRYWCLKAFSLMDHVMLRDKRSESIIRQSKLNINHKLSYDLALSYNHFFHKSKPTINTEKILGVSLTARGFERCSLKHSKICEMYVELIKAVLDSEFKPIVRLYAVCSDEEYGDVELCEHVKGRLQPYLDRVIVVKYENDIDDHLNSLYECSAVIATRMHAGIMAILHNVPTYQITYAEKISEFYSHASISDKYLRNMDELSTNDMYQFLSDAFDMRLVDFVECQCSVLNGKGMNVVKDLEELSEL